MIYYGKLLRLLEENHITSYTVKNEKLLGQETLRKIKAGTGIFDEGYDASTKSNGKQVKKVRLTAIDTKAIEALCIRLNCQPSDIMRGKFCSIVRNFKLHKGRIAATCTDAGKLEKDITT